MHQLYGSSIRKIYEITCVVAVKRLFGLWKNYAGYRDSHRFWGSDCIIFCRCFRCVFLKWERMMVRLKWSKDNRNKIQEYFYDDETKRVYKICLEHYFEEFLMNTWERKALTPLPRSCSRRECRLYDLNCEIRENTV